MTLRIRLLVLAATLVCFAVIALQVRRRQMRTQYLVLWTSLCVPAIVLVAFPGLLDRVASALGIYYAPAALFLVAVVVLFLISMQFSRELSRLDERTRILAEELAIERALRERDAREREPAPGAPATSTEEAAPPRGELIDTPRG